MTHRTSHRRGEVNEKIISYLACNHMHGIGSGSGSCVRAVTIPVFLIPTLFMSVLGLTLPLYQYSNPDDRILSNCEDSIEFHFVKENVYCPDRPHQQSAISVVLLSSSSNGQIQLLRAMSLRRQFFHFYFTLLSLIWIRISGVNSLYLSRSRGFVSKPDQ
jgi:hypothetical protein